MPLAEPLRDPEVVTLPILLLFFLCLVFGVGVSREVDGGMELEAGLDAEEVTDEQRVSFACDAGLEDGERILELAYSIAHFSDLSVEAIGVR